MILEQVTEDLSPDYPNLVPRWQMSACERITLVGLLSSIRPQISIEIGTRDGGSLAVIAKHSRRVYSLDIDPTVPQRMKPFDNVEYITGNSRDTLPRLLTQLAEQNDGPEFILVDGDHSAQGARHDCQNILNVRPTRKLRVLIHDSFNPDVRRGIKMAQWSANPYVHALYLDFTKGIVTHKSRFWWEMWQGFALAVLKPEERTTPLVIEEEAYPGYRIARLYSVHNPVLHRAGQLLGAFPSRFRRR